MKKSDGGGKNLKLSAHQPETWAIKIKRFLAENHKSKWFSDVEMKA